MNRRQYLIGAVLVLVSALGAYTATLATRSPASQPAAGGNEAADAVMTWLNVPASQREQIRLADPAFAGDLKRLRADVAERKAGLAALLEKPGAGSDEIMAGLEQVITASNALDRRTAQYLLAVRSHLTAEQQHRLLNLCAEEVRQPRRYQWGRGGGAGGPPAVDAPRGRHGRGPGGGGPGGPPSR